ncbi:insulinase family protein [Sphingomonas sp. MAH-20]|uniref:Insulinase family protein n=1 Tax=Sphingomonas horti TaxID=2682842 RepID=A0A6I4J3Z7_9SPHN|nr:MULTISPECIES: pitrilysin family protein [Sphingomonas]MBA2921158.1 insulinase family protein [Sphingomonas sp. CGMCC 1.13658]MVO79399.1 insulinase family protein [Sphingomonas horti]
MRRSWLAASLLALSSTALAQTAAPAPLSELSQAVNIPYEQFTLPNGLRVIVSTDRKAPIVAVSVWYNVGSKMEPKGKTGYAHLFEHLMFNGSENAPGDFFKPLQEIGATDVNGTTWFDRTNYFETVPTPALERALFLESDRMGHFLGAVTQENLKNQIGVVQNEKRQGDNQPFGLVEYAQLKALIPADHPYGHSTIGSMADLDAASLDDVKGWFRQHYGPNNAVLVLAGDIDVPTAKRLVTKYFGDIPKGPQQGPVVAPVPTPAQRIDEVMKDRVATTRIYRTWVVPGLNDPDAVPLDIAASVLGGLSSSRLDNALVRGDKSAVRVSAELQQFAQISFFDVQVDVAPGVDVAEEGRKLDRLIADYIANGPTADEVLRSATRDVAGRTAALESVGGFGGKAVTLAEGSLYSNDPGFYNKQLAAYAAATPAQVRAAMQKWLSRPMLALVVEPGPRGAYEESKSVAGPSGFAPAYYHKPGEAPVTFAPPAVVDRSQLPPVGPIPNLDFPTVERAKLSNGIELVYAQRTATPITRMVVSFDAGNAADPADKLGLQSLTLSLLDEGTKTRSSIQIAEEEERLGANIGAGTSTDRTSVSLFALSPNLQPSVELLADILRNPAFAPAEVERLRKQQLVSIVSEMTQPGGLAQRTLLPVLFGRDHPYGRPTSGLGDAAVVEQLKRDELIDFHRAWIRPDKATIFIVSDQPLAKVRGVLDAALGDWKGEGAPGTKAFTAAVPPAQPRIILVDRPDSPQSLIYSGEVTSLKGRDELLPYIAANDVLGGNFLSRLNTDIRETKGWSYGVNGSFRRLLNGVPYIVSAPVQADRTGDSVAAMQADIRAFLTTEGITPEEKERTILGFVRELPGSFETGSDVLGGMQNNVLYGRPDDYYDTIASRYRALTAPEMDKAIRSVIDPSKFVWVVVGDAKAVKPQLDRLGLPVEVKTVPQRTAQGEK